MTRRRPAPARSASHPWTNTKEVVDLCTDWKRYRYSLTTEGFGDENSSLFFFMGAEKGEVKIDDVRLDIESETTNLLTNGSFDDALTGWVESGIEESSTEGRIYQVGVVPPNLDDFLGEGNRVLDMLNMWSQYLIETRGRDTELLDWTFKTGGAYRADLIIAYTKGMLARDPETADLQLRKSRELKEEPVARMEANDDGSASNDLVLDHLAIFELQLQVSLAKASGDLPGAIVLAREADRLEGLMPYSFGPPTVPYPSAELLGELLLDAGDFEGAATAFREELKRARNRTHTLDGLREAEAGLLRSADAQQRET